MSDEERRQLFSAIVRDVATRCGIREFRCHVFDDSGEISVFAVGERACKGRAYRGSTGDGRCGEGGAAALLRHLAALSYSGLSAVALATSLRDAARQTFDTDEKFEKWIGGKA